MPVKSLPQRSCVACRMTKTKRELVRVVRTPAQQVLLDASGKLAGRGAYLCPSQSCLNDALKNHRLERALGLPLAEAARETLTRHMAELATKAGLTPTESVT